MPHINYNRDGLIQISNEVISSITTKATMEVEGVFSISTNFAEDIIEKIGKKFFSKGINISVENGDVKVNLNIIVKANYKVYDVATEVQNKVKSAIELMTNLNVSTVNVNIAGIEISKGKHKDKNN